MVGTSCYGTSISDNVWTTWAGSTDSTTCYGNTTTDAAWRYWVDDGTSSTTSVTITDADCYTVWSHWEVIQRGVVEHVYKEPTPEQKAAQEAAAEERRRRQAEKEERDRLAAQKADELLESLLTEEAIRVYRKHRYIEAWSKSGRRFKIKHGRAHNIIELDKAGKEVRKFCVHVTPHDIPNTDNMLAQKLLIEHQEDVFHKLANVTELQAA
jgi:hypothetical protein